MDGFERRKEHSKGDIRRAAEELFTRFGPDRVSVNEIAKRAGVSQATIYNNFGSKERLVREYHSGLVGSLATRFKEILKWKKSYIDKMAGLFQTWIDYADRYGEGKPARQMLEVAGESGSAGTLDAEFDEALAQFVKDGKGSGDIDGRLPDELVMAYMRMLRKGLQCDGELQRRMRSDPNFARELWRLSTRGLKAEQPSNIR